MVETSIVEGFVARGKLPVAAAITKPFQGGEINILDFIPENNRKSSTVKNSLAVGAGRDITFEMVPSEFLFSLNPNPLHDSFFV